MQENSEPAAVALPATRSSKRAAFSEFMDQIYCELRDRSLPRESELLKQFGEKFQAVLMKIQALAATIQQLEPNQTIINHYHSKSDVLVRQARLKMRAINACLADLGEVELSVLSVTQNIQASNANDETMLDSSLQDLHLLSPEDDENELLQIAAEASEATCSSDDELFSSMQSVSEPLGCRRHSNRQPASNQHRTEQREQLRRMRSEQLEPVWPRRSAAEQPLRRRASSDRYRHEPPRYEQPCGEQFQKEQSAHEQRSDGRYDRELFRPAQTWRPSKRSESPRYEQPRGEQFRKEQPAREQRRAGRFEHESCRPAQTWRPSKRSKSPRYEQPCGEEFQKEQPAHEQRSDGRHDRELFRPAQTWLPSKRSEAPRYEQPWGEQFRKEQPALEQRSDGRYDCELFRPGQTWRPSQQSKSPRNEQPHGEQF